MVKAGKRVFLTGDLNIIREEIDTANLAEQLKKRGGTVEEYFSTPARRIFNHLLVGGKVFGERDEGREKPVMWDICRFFHPDRKGMFTCWEQKINARPGNFGSRIDYVLCSEDWKDWFSESNIQEGLLGSDHCPVYAVLKRKISISGKEVDLRDIMSNGMFKDGIRQREWSTKDLLPTSAKLIPEFDRRRNIRDMFIRKPSELGGGLNERGEVSPEKRISSSSKGTSTRPETETIPDENLTDKIAQVDGQPRTEWQSSSPLLHFNAQPTVNAFSKSPGKRPPETVFSRTPKKSKAVAITKTSSKGEVGKGQSKLSGFFKPRLPQYTEQADDDGPHFDLETSHADTANELKTPVSKHDARNSRQESAEFSREPFDLSTQKDIVDPIVAKETWSKLLSKRVVPRCEHNEPCISYTTKKPGVNCGRSFYMCPRPLGPSGQKEKNTQWRCGTFIWSSDWTGDGI